MGLAPPGPQRLQGRLFQPDGRAGRPSAVRASPRATWTRAASTLRRPWRDWRTRRASRRSGSAGCAALGHEVGGEAEQEFGGLDGVGARLSRAGDFNGAAVQGLGHRRPALGVQVRRHARIGAGGVRAVGPLAAEGQRPPVQRFRLGVAAEVVQGRGQDREVVGGSAVTLAEAGHVDLVGQAIEGFGVARPSIGAADVGQGGGGGGGLGALDAEADAGRVQKRPPQRFGGREPAQALERRGVVRAGEHRLGVVRAKAGQGRLVGAAEEGFGLCVASLFRQRLADPGPGRRGGRRGRAVNLCLQARAPATGLFQPPPVAGGLSVFGFVHEAKPGGLLGRRGIARRRRGDARRS